MVHGKGLSIQRLSKCIVLYVETCYNKEGCVPLLYSLKTHSIRSVAVLETYLGKVPIFEIPKAATWCWGNTFIP